MDRVSWYNSIRFRIPAIIALITLIPMAAFWYYVSNLSRENLLAQTASFLYTNLYGTSLLMQDAMDQVSDFSREISQDRAFGALAEEYQLLREDPQEHERVRSQLSLALSQYVGQLRTLDSIYLIFEDSKTVVTTLPDQKELTRVDPYGRRLYQLYYDELESPIVWALLPAAGGAQDMLSYIRPISLAQGFGRCVLICNLKPAAWRPALNGLGLDDGDAYISSYAGRLLLSTREDGVYDLVGQEDRFSQAFSSGEDSGTYTWHEEGQDYLVAYYNALESGWKYLVCIPEESILSGATDSRTFTAIALLCGGFSVLLGSLALYWYVVRPIRILMGYMKAMEGGQLEQTARIETRDELGLLFQSYNHMVGRLNKLIDEVYVQQLLHKQAQLSFLQSQMDEHFLYNTLNTIYSQACHEKASASARMILILSKYFRLSLSHGQDKLPLDQIAELIRHYLQLQRMRFGGALECRMEQFPDMADYVALKYLFQPIVENAMVHGFETLQSSHCIQIIFRREGKQLYFEVADDGAGVPPHRLEPLLQQINGQEPAAGEGFALKNIREQMRIAYGGGRIDMENRPEGGTRVFFRIPLERREQP